MPAVKKIAEKHEKLGIVSNTWFSSFNNQRVVRSCLKQLGYIPDDEYAPSLWYSKDYQRYKNMTVIERVRTQLVEGKVVTASSAKASSSTLKATIYTLRSHWGWEIDTVKTDYFMSGYKLRQKEESGT